MLINLNSLIHLIQFTKIFIQPIKPEIDASHFEPHSLSAT